MRAYFCPVNSWSSNPFNHANSFDYQVGLAEKAQKAGDTKNAIACYENALALDKNSIEVRLALAKLYTEENDYDSALVLYQEVIRADRKNRQACKGLIAIYEKQNNTDAILSLSEAVDDSLEVLKMPRYYRCFPQKAMKFIIR